MTTLCDTLRLLLALTLISLLLSPINPHKVFSTFNQDHWCEHGFGATQWSSQLNTKIPRLRTSVVTVKQGASAHLWTQYNSSEVTALPKVSSLASIWRALEQDEVSLNGSPFIGFYARGTSITSAEWLAENWCQLSQKLGQWQPKKRETQRD